MAADVNGRSLLKLMSNVLPNYYTSLLRKPKQNVLLSEIFKVTICNKLGIFDTNEDHLYR